MAPHGVDVLRRLEARHGSCYRTALRVLLLRPDLVDPKRFAASRDDVAIPLVLAGKTLHQGKFVTSELADLPAGRDVPKAHRVVAAGADDLCAVADERYLSHGVFVSRQRVHLQNTPDSDDANA